jgi:CheY-like chemotaxis protein
MLLPATNAEDKAPLACAADESPQALVGSVLLVDDDPGVRLILSEHLRDLGLRVATAEDGRQALTVLEADGSDLEFVLTDYSMPGMDGIALLSAVGEKWPQIRGAIMTGNPQEHVSRSVLQVPLIHKPLDVHELKRLLASG